MEKTTQEVEPKQLILQARHITVVGHVAPDGDVIGSMLGFCSVLSRLNKECVAVLADEVPAMFAFLPGVERIVVKPKKLGPTDLIVVLDVGDPQRIGNLYSDNLDLFRAVPILNIDHHSTNSFATTSAIIDTTAAASAELIVALMHELSVPIDAVSAICLLAAVVSDTQCFRTPSTTTRTLEIATELMSAGASLPWIVDCLYKSQPFAKMALWGHALATIRLSRGVVWACVTRDAIAKSGASIDDTDGLVDVLAVIKEAKVAALFKEAPGGATRISLRSSGRVNVAELASYFGGGGHPGAAGISLECSIDEAQDLVIGHINRQLPSIEQ
ncbi:MAG: DHH family phosphoesterase [Chloroflexi bacterium]|nr:DHH family phosphoesterase [Chloroflexota bacterium]